MQKLFHEEYKAIITLPPRNDTEAETYEEYEFKAGELLFGGQQYIFPEGFKAQVSARWLDDELLHVAIYSEGIVETECARCLKPVSLEISGELMYLYYSHDAGVPEDDEYMPVEVDYLGRVLDVMPQIEESIYTLIPTKILCREDCKGLCPNCGKDLNEGACTCGNENTDPRLEALRNFVVE